MSPSSFETVSISRQNISGNKLKLNLQNVVGNRDICGIVVDSQNLLCVDFYIHGSLINRIPASHAQLELARFTYSLTRSSYHIAELTFFWSTDNNSINLIFMVLPALDLPFDKHPYKEYLDLTQIDASEIDSLEIIDEKLGGVWNEIVYKNGMAGQKQFYGAKILRDINVFNFFSDH